jgi:hypothetical protein
LGNLVALVPGDAIPVGSQEVAVAFNFIGECTV